MLKDYHSVREVATAIADAADETIRAYRESRAPYEPNITDRLMGAIEQSVNSLPVSPLETELFSADEVTSPRLARMATRDKRRPAARRKRKPLVWRAATLKAGSGSGAEEKEFGADIMGVLTIDLPEYKVAKGFLAQAKRAEPAEEFSKSEWSRLRIQCNLMLGITPDAFVLAYSKQRGVRFFSAEAVAAYSGGDLFDLYHMSVRTFFERHLESFIGDRRLHKPHLDVVRAVYRTRDGEKFPDEHVLHLKAREVE